MQSCEALLDDRACFAISLRVGVAFDGLRKLTFTKARVVGIRKRFDELLPAKTRVSGGDRRIEKARFRIVHNDGYRLE